MKRWAWCAVIVFLDAPLTIGQGSAYMTYADAKPVLEALREDLWPEALRGKTSAQLEAAWPLWVAERDRAIRERVAEGDEDSLVHLVLFGTSFTNAPRLTSRELAALAKEPGAGLASLQPRINDFVAAVASPRQDERLQFAREVIARHGGDARAYIEARTKAWAADTPSARLLDPDAAPTATLTLFRDRGLSSDTSIFIDLAIEQALQAIKDDGLVRAGAVRRVAIVGPGLDIIDKQNGFDFYPQQTIQPFAVIDSLLRFGLATSGDLDIVAFDLSPRVVQHLDTARERARSGMPYALVLPRPLDRPWTPPLVEYWGRLGNFTAQDVASGFSRKIEPPPNAGRIEIRGVTVRPSLVLATTPRDLNIVLQRIAPASEKEQFDLIVATNILLYYDVFEQSLAAANIAAMLRVGGIFLTNTRIVELPDTPLSAVGHTNVTYMALPGIGDTGDRVTWYQKP
jgi:hypothetical protein